MQVRSSHSAGLPDFAYPGTPVDLITQFDAGRAEMTIHSDKALAMIDDDRIAIEEIVANRCHFASSRRNDGGAGRGGDIHTAMGIAGLIIEDAPRAEGTGTGAAGWYCKVGHCRLV